NIFSMPRTGDQIKENINMAVGEVKQHLGHLMKNEKMTRGGAEEVARAKVNLEQIHSEAPERAAESAVRSTGKRPSIVGGFGNRVREAASEVADNVRSLGHKKD
ncbi:hypothetical protein EC988_002048, partial [Linderina pennispora]